MSRFSLKRIKPTFPVKNAAVTWLSRSADSVNSLLVPVIPTVRAQSLTLSIQRVNVPYAAVRLSARSQERVTPSSAAEITPIVLS